MNVYLLRLATGKEYRLEAGMLIATLYPNSLQPIIWSKILNIGYSEKSL